MAKLVSPEADGLTPQAGSFSRRSAIQTFMIDCLGTPRRLASLSRQRIIQVGKSTLSTHKKGTETIDW